MKTNQIFFTAIAGILSFALGTHVAEALDTDVYLKSQNVTRNDLPNVLIILDNSGSMEDDIPASRPAYDPTVDYCSNDLDTTLGIFGANSGKPSGCSGIANRVYFTFASPTAAPAYNSTTWFASSKNKCYDSTTPLSNYGIYGGTKIAKWRSGGSNGWKTLSSTDDSVITYVDCQMDEARATAPVNSVADGLVLNDGKYALNSTSTAHANSGGAFNWTNFTTNSSPTLYTSNYMNYWYNTELGTSRPKMNIAKDAVISLINANTGVRFGLMVFNEDTDNDSTSTGNHGGRVMAGVDDMDDARRLYMSNLVRALQPETNTPLAETLWEAYRYLGGISMDFGDNNPLLTISSITRSSTTATVTTSSNHNFTTGNLVLISGATQSQYNGAFNITVTSSTQFTYTVSGSPTTPAGGTKKATLFRDFTVESGSNYVTPFAFACQKTYVIYVTDGDPTKDTAANTKIRTTTGNSTCGSSGGSCLDTLSGWMHTHDVVPSLLGNQTVTTFTVGFGTGISASGLALLQATAVQGGGSYTAATNADQLSSALQGYITNILQDTTSFTAPALSINAFNKQFNNSDVYLSVFKPASSCAWDGNIKKYRLCGSSDIALNRCTNLSDVLDVDNHLITDINHNIIDTAKSYWSASADGSEVKAGGAGSNIPAGGSRNMYTYYAADYSGLSGAPSAGIPLVKTVGNTFRTAAVADPTILGLPSGSSPGTVDALIEWMRGLVDSDGDTQIDDPRWAMGDPLHSRATPITYGCVGSATTCTSSSTPITKLFVGGNDGTIRMFNNDTGVEEWAFIPKELYSMQYQLSQDTDNDHLYGVDSTPAFWVKDIDNNGIINPTAGDRVYMFIGMRRGGRNIYAFDVTPAATLTSLSTIITPKLMWVIQGGIGNFVKLGQTWSQPRIARVRYDCSVASDCNDNNSNTDDSKSRVVLMFGGGYDTNQDNAIPAGTDSMGNAIYMVDPITGARIWWASNSGATLNLTQMKYGIPSDLTLIDTNGDGAMDRLYVGDTGGQVWRVDLGISLKANVNGGTNGYVFADFGCTGGARSNDCAATTEQNRRKFFYPPEVAPVKDTVYSATPNYDMVAIGSGDREDPLDLLNSNLSAPASKEAVHNRIYAVRDYKYLTGSPTPTPSAITETTMYDATANNLGTFTGTALTTEVDNNVKNKSGWYIDLHSAAAITVPNGLTTTWIGEKMLAKATIFNGVLHATTYSPANVTNTVTTCTAQEGVAMEYTLNLLSAVGAADFDGDGDNERSGQIGGGIPSEVVIVVRPEATIGLINAGGKGGAPIKSTGIKGNTNTRTYWYEE